MNYKRTQEELFRLADTWMEKMRAEKEFAELPDSVEYAMLNSSKSLGRCRAKSKKNRIFQILYSKALLEMEEKEIIGTIVHEFIHTLPGCFDHGYLFRWKANAANSKYGLHIGRLASSEVSKAFEKTEFYQKKIKYEVVCLKCGKHISFKRKTTLIKEIKSGIESSQCHSSCKGEHFWLITDNGVDVSEKWMVSRGVTEKELMDFKAKFRPDLLPKSTETEEIEKELFAAESVAGECSKTKERRSGKRKSKKKDPSLTLFEQMSLF